MSHKTLEIDNLLANIYRLFQERIYEQWIYNSQLLISEKTTYPSYTISKKKYKEIHFGLYTTTITT